MSLKVLELFGGIGACSKALEKLCIDYEIVDYVEIDKYAVASFNAIHNTHFEEQDITQWDKQIDVDLIMHGSPCQDFSLSGKQAGGDEGSGTRSSLMYETIRIVEKLKPKYVIWENVKNLLSKKHRHNFDKYLETMESLGYKNYYQVLNAKDYGIPQNRERVFTISIYQNSEIKVIGNYMPSGYDASRIVDINGIAPTVKENHGTITAIGEEEQFVFPPKQELKLRLKDMLENEVDEKYYLSEDKIDKISHWKGFQKPFEKVQGKNSIVPTLTARGAGEEHNGMITYSELLENTSNMQEECLNIKNATKKGYLEAFEGDSINLSYPDSNTRRGRVGEQISQTLQCNDSMGVVTKYKEYTNFYTIPRGSDGKLINGSYNRVWKEEKQIGTINLTKIQEIGKKDINNNLRIRKLTPKECWRLMGFDDEDYEKASQVCSNAQLYKQAGNSIVVNVLMAIFKELL